MSTPTWPQLVVPPSPITAPPIGAIVDWATPTPPVLWLICDGTSVGTAAYPDLFHVIGYAFGGSGASFNLPDLRGRVTVAASPTLALAATGGASTVTLSAAQMPGHAHGAENASADHNHAFSATSGNESANHNHSGGTSNDLNDHAHHLGFDVIGGIAPGAGGTGGYEPIVGDKISGGITSNHTHNFTSGLESGAHSHAVSGTSGLQSGSHSHVIDSFGGGGAHENMPPFLVLYKIIRAEVG